MPESAPRPSGSPAIQELFELLSRQQDGDLVGEESQRLAMLQSTHSKEAERFRQQTRELSCRLKQMPVHAVEGLLFELPVMTPPRAIDVPSPLSVARRSGAQRVVVGTVTSLLCAGLLFLLIRRTETNDSALLAEAEVLHGTIEARGGNAGPLGFGDPMSADGPMVADSIQMKVAAGGPSNVLMGASASAESGASTAAIPEFSSEPDVQPLIQSDDWNVVVVKIDERDRDQAMDQIQSIVRKAGLQLKDSAGHDESRWMGVVLTSNLTGREDVVNAMEGVGTSNGYVTETPPVDSQEAMFIAAARESLKHPTRSELHHGKVFVALPSCSAMNEQGQVVADAERSDGGDSNATNSEEALVSVAPVEASGARSAKVSAKVVPTVTLVVFEFSDGEKSGPNSSEQQI